MKERRRAPRILIAVLLEFYSEHRERLIGKGFITNLSENGLALETQENLEHGENVKLHFKLLDSLILDLKAKVVYARGGVLNKAYGVEFCDISQQTSTQLRDFITGRFKQ